MHGKLKTHLLRLLFGFLLFFTAGCEICTCKKIMCPGFSDPLFEQWAPYTTDQLLVFKTTSGVTDTIRISGVQKSEAYEGRTGGGYGCGKGCFTSINIYGVGTDTFYLKNFRMSASGKSKPGKKEVYVSLMNTSFNAMAVTDTGFSVYNYDANPVSSRFQATITIGTKTFNNVQTIAYDTFYVKKTGVYKFYFAKNIGLVGLETYPDTKLRIKE